MPLLPVPLFKEGIWLVAAEICVRVEVTLPESRTLEDRNVDGAMKGSGGPEEKRSFANASAPSSGMTIWTSLDRVEDIGEALSFSRSNPLRLTETCMGEAVLEMDWNVSID